MFNAMLIAMALSAAPAGQADLSVQAPEGDNASWRVEVREQPLSAVIDALRNAGVQFEGGPARPDLLVSGQYQGDLSTVLTRLLRTDDFVVSEQDGVTMVHVLSGAVGAEPGTIEAQYGPVRIDAEGRAMAEEAARADVASGADVIGVLMAQRLAQAGGASVAGPTGSVPAGGSAATSGAASPEQISAMNQQARQQLAGLVAALRAACPEGASCN